MKRTAAATAARIRQRLDRQADELRAHGFFVVSPEEMDRGTRDRYGCVVMQVDWPPIS